MILQQQSGSVTYIKLAGNEHGSGPQELELFPAERLHSQVMIHHLDGQVQGLVVELKVLLDLHQPVYQDGSHGG